MGSFAAVTAGNATFATDINQYANILNGLTIGQLFINGGTGASGAPYQGFFSAAPSAATAYLKAYVTGDALYRLQAMIASSANGGVGQLAFGDGTNYKGSFLGENNGAGTGLWTDHSFRVAAGGVSVTGGLTADSLTTSGNATIAGSATVSGDPVITNASQATVCQVFTGTATPTGANPGDLWIKG